MQSLVRLETVKQNFQFGATLLVNMAFTTTKDRIDLIFGEKRQPAAE